MSRILLKGGTVLVHDSDHVNPQQVDILIEDDRIREIREAIQYDGVEVIDCKDKIVSPGFVDTHHHMWETSLKGVAEDETAPNYFATSRMIPWQRMMVLTDEDVVFTAPFTLGPKDVFWGNLSGCLEAIDAGTTTALDFAHLNWTEKHCKSSH